MVCNGGVEGGGPGAGLERRNPLTGLSGLQQLFRSTLGRLLKGRNPLTGLSGLQQCLTSLGTLPTSRCSRNPLTGLSGLQRVGAGPRVLHPLLRGSQSPYGAKWFATHKLRLLTILPPGTTVAIPLRG